MYNKMAEVYDELMRDAPYDKWLNFTNRIIRDIPGQNVLEIGCGTGEIAIRLANEGYEVNAFDLSDQMIEIAQKKTKCVIGKTNFFQADITQLKLNQRFDLAISYCDVFNYLVTVEDLKQALANTYYHLNEQGVFIFDVHSQAYVDWLVEQGMFSEIREDISYIWLCEPGDHFGEIFHDLTFFIQKDGELYERQDEWHVQRTHSVQHYKQLLKDIGFKKINVYFDFTFNIKQKNEEDADRIFFVCYK
ncbi:class I SAM-dependent DNA methyltransferase [Tenuibacillus multivorans]|uniref:Ubiquinone/menaquinone biosynthesis C-methylase UbiE n=1 Tax=Tenuibacillus multivorans TaxID=237069 RepID=A0A1G9ZFV9_9BACI|nr:class I SAM-dependent methyltransferase [Tenuibacillus multivorans]GEL77524.1 methyltransferase [Tenuibacillus multivorans]SDN20075.1 Ubiquinone/menaquinone biosynthesis C-methylase UbiE [Tenuibacillus multivorans]